MLHFGQLSFILPSFVVILEKRAAPVFVANKNNTHSSPAGPQRKVVRCVKMA